MTPANPAHDPIRGLNSQTTPGLGLGPFLEVASRAGFDGIELTGELIADTHTAARMLGDYGLKLLSVSPTEPLRGWHVSWDPALAARLGRELESAVCMGADFFVLPFMREGADPGSVRHGLTEAVRLAEAVSIKLAVEPIGHFAGMRRAEELAPVLRTFDPARVGLLLDSFHWFRAGHTTRDLALYHGVHILALQLSNANARPTEELLGYRDRNFPLDGPFPVSELYDQVIAQRPHTPLVVEVIGDVAWATPPDLAAQTAMEQLDRLIAGPSQEQT